MGLGSSIYLFPKWGSNSTKVFEQVPDTLNTIKRIQAIVTEQLLQKMLYHQNCIKDVFEVLIENSKPNRIDMFIGFVEYKKEGGYTFSDHLGSKSNKNTGIDQYSVYLYSYGYGTRQNRPIGVYNLGKNKDLFDKDRKLQADLIGDRIGMEIDFENNKCNLYLNGEFMDVIFDHVPKIIVPAVSVYDTDVVISVSAFDLFTHSK